jgi:hypothetical protein
VFASSRRGERAVLAAWFHWDLSLGDAIVGIGTLALAGFTYWLGRQTRSTAQLASLELAAQQRPELVAYQVPAGGLPRTVYMPGAAYGRKTGSVWLQARAEVPKVNVVSFDVENIGPGAAEIARIRLMSLPWPGNPRSTGSRISPIAG